MNSIAASSEPLLRLSNINTFYGQAQVHFDLSIDVPRGHIVCLLGGNASGKSTTMKIILGLVRPRSGELVFDGASMLGLTTPQIVRRGIASVPEARRLFADMSVRENILMGAFVRNDSAEVTQDLDKMLTLFPKLGQRMSQRDDAGKSDQRLQQQILNEVGRIFRSASRRGRFRRDFRHSLIKPCCTASNTASPRV